jgi:hypothetical protein
MNTNTKSTTTTTKLIESFPKNKDGTKRSGASCKYQSSMTILQVEAKKNRFQRNKRGLFNKQF